MTEDGFVGGGRPLEAVMSAAMQAVLSASSDAVITLDADDKVILFNPAAERLFGVPAAEALGRPLRRFLPERSRDRHERFVRLFRKTGETERRMGAARAISGLRANGEEFPMEAWISRAEVEGEVFVTVVLRDVSERRLIEEARLQILLAREIEHRARNALTAVQALVKTTDADTKEELIKALRGRIAAFARGYSLLVMNAWADVDLMRLVETELRASAAPDQLRVEGPPVKLAPHAVQPVGLILHELATNALKYGALSQPGGLVHLSWRVTPNRTLELTWRETGGPVIAERPSSQGFGSVLLDELVVKQLHGALAFDWRPEGLVVVLSIPLATAEEPGAPAPPGSA